MCFYFNLLLLYLDGWEPLADMVQTSFYAVWHMSSLVDVCTREWASVCVINVCIRAMST